MPTSWLRRAAARRRAPPNDLRDRRGELLKQLSEKVRSAPSKRGRGAVNVLVGSEFLVLEGTSAEVTTTISVDRGIRVDTPVFAATGTKLSLTGGELAGLSDSIRKDIPRSSTTSTTSRDP